MLSQPLAPKVLVVEDDDATRQALVLGLGDDAIVTGAADVNQAVRFAAIQPPDVIVLDLALDPNRPGAVNGPDVLTRLRSKGIPVPPVIVVSAGIAGLEIARAISAAAYFPKPIDLGAVADKIRELSRSGVTASAARSHEDGAAAP